MLMTSQPRSESPKTAWLGSVTDAKLREAAEAIIALCDKALEEHKVFVGPLPRRMKVADRERAAYLHGVLAGAAAAAREIEKRRSFQFVGSE